MVRIKYRRIHIPDVCLFDCHKKEFFMEEGEETFESYVVALNHLIRWNQMYESNCWQYAIIGMESTR